MSNELSWNFLYMSERRYLPPYHRRMTTTAQDDFKRDNTARCTLRTKPVNHGPAGASRHAQVACASRRESSGPSTRTEATTSKPPARRTSTDGESPRGSIHRHELRADARRDEESRRLRLRQPAQRVRGVRFGPPAMDRQDSEQHGRRTPVLPQPQQPLLGIQPRLLGLSGAMRGDDAPGRPENALCIYLGDNPPPKAPDLQTAGDSTGI